MPIETDKVKITDGIDALYRAALYYEANPKHYNEDITFPESLYKLYEDHIDTEQAKDAFEAYK